MTRELTSDECNAILDKITTKLHDGSPKARTVLNTLSLIEFLLKNGSPRFKIEIEEDQFFIKKLRNFHDDSDDDDLSNSIQTLAQRIIALIENPEELKTAKEEAKKLRTRIHGFSNEADEDAPPQSADPKYQGFSSDNYQNEKFDMKGGSNLARRLGMEGREEGNGRGRGREEESTPKPEKPVAEIKEPVDLLDFDSNSAPKKAENFLDDGPSPNAMAGQAKAKFGSKLLPPPPGKGGARPAQPSKPTSTPLSASPLDLDFNSLDFSQPKTQPTSQQVQYDTILTGVPKQVDPPKSNGLLEFDVDFTSTGSVQPQAKPAHPTPKEDFDFDFSAPVTQAKPAPQPTLKAQDFDFDIPVSQPASTQASQPMTQLTNASDTKKAFGKLPAPPKKGNQAEAPAPSQPKNDSDFLF